MKTLLLALMMTLPGLSGRLCAEPVVVVNAASLVRQLSQDEVINIFLGRYRSLPGGGQAVPIDQPESSPLRAEFYRRLVNKDLNDINAYWSRLIFSGRTAPPLQPANTAELLNLLLAHPAGIAYLERSQLDRRWRIVMEFPR